MPTAGGDLRRALDEFQRTLDLARAQIEPIRAAGDRATPEQWDDYIRALRVNREALKRLIQAAQHLDTSSVDAVSSALCMRDAAAERARVYHQP